jgi:hypothetical protein
MTINKDDDDDDDDDLCEVTGTEQGPHPKVAVHGAVFFAENDKFPINSIVSHATDPKLPVGVSMYPGHVVRGKYVPLKIVLSNGTRPQWVPGLEELLEGTNKFTASTAKMFHKALIGMGPGAYPLGEGSGDFLLVMTQYQTAEFLAERKCIAKDSLHEQFDDVQYDKQDIVTLYDSLDNQTHSFYHMLGCPTYYKAPDRSGGFSKKYVKAMNLDMPFEERAAARIVADDAEQLALSK